MAYTSRSEAREFKCPECEAEPGHKCIGARGKVRESVHLERLKVAADSLGHGPVGGVVLTDGTGTLTDATTGRVLGRVHNLTIAADVQGQEELWENLRRGGEELGSGVELSKDQGSLSPEGSAEGQAKPQGELLADPVVETWELYAKLLDRPRVKLSSKVRKWIAEAHTAVGVERTNDAIRGLAASDYHRQNGYIGIEYAIKPKVSETIEGRIEMMATKAPAARANGETTVDQLIARLSSDSQVMVHQWVEEIKQWLRYRDHRGLAATAQTRINDLRERVKIEPVIEGDEIVDWKDLR